MLTTKNLISVLTGVAVAIWSIDLLETHDPVMEIACVCFLVAHLIVWLRVMLSQ